MSSLAKNNLTRGKEGAIPVTLDHALAPQLFLHCHE